MTSESLAIILNKLIWKCLPYSHFAIQTRKLKDWWPQYSTVPGLDMNIFVVPLLVYAIYIYVFLHVYATLYVKS